MKEFYFERLDVWKDARILVKCIYVQTSCFPSDEKFGIISQIRRAALGITANIAEGMSRQSDKEKARFVNQAFGSAVEIVNFLILALDLNLINEEQYLELRNQSERITNKLNSLHKKLLENIV